MTPDEAAVPEWVVTAASRHEFTLDCEGRFWVRRRPGVGPGDPSGLPVLVTQLRSDSVWLQLLAIGAIRLGERAAWIVALPDGRTQPRTTTAVVEVLWRDGRHERLAASGPLVDGSGRTGDRR